MIYNNKEKDYYYNNLYRNNAGSLPLLGEQETLELFKKMHQGDLESREKLINSNLRLVLKVCSNYSYNTNDMIQVGNIGLIKAVDRYDINKGTKFSTYAVSYIEGYIKRYIGKELGIAGLPAYVGYKYLELEEIIDQFKNTHDKSPSIDELVSITGWNKNTIIDILNATQKPISINQSYSEIDRENPLETILIDERSSLMEENIINSINYKNLMDNIQDNLTEKDFNIFVGLYIKKYTTRELAAKYGVSHQRITQRKNDIIKKITKVLIENELYVPNRSKYYDNIEHRTLSNGLSFFESFDNTKEEILNSLSKLNDNDRKFLLFIYPNGFSNSPIQLHKHEQDHLNRIKYKLKLKKVVREEKPLGSYLKFATKEEIDYIISFSKPYIQEAVKKAYPNGYNEKPIYKDEKQKNIVRAFTQRAKTFSKKRFNQKW